MYYKNGQLASTSNHETGTVQGYFESGEIKFSGFIEGNNREGIWMFFNKDATLEKTEAYKDDKLIE